MLQKIRRRDLIVLTGLFGLAGTVVIAVILLILQDAERYQTTTTVPSIPQQTETIPYQQTTGLNQYKLAQTSALSWADDAQLIAVNAQWPNLAGRSEVGKPGEWSYHFYSSSKARKYLITVQPDGQIQTVEHIIPVQLIPIPINVDDWLIDSPTALAVWLENGGSVMVGRNPGMEIVAQLRAVQNSSKPVWMVVGLNNQTNEIVSIRVDATQGTILR